MSWLYWMPYLYIFNVCIIMHFWLHFLCIRIHFPLHSQIETFHLWCSNFWSFYLEKVCFLCNLCFDHFCYFQKSGGQKRIFRLFRLWKKFSSGEHFNWRKSFSWNIFHFIFRSWLFSSNNNLIQLTCTRSLLHLVFLLLLLW